MKKLAILLCTFLFIGAVKVQATCPVSGPTPCNTGDEITCKMPICNLCGCNCNCDCACFKLTKEDIYEKLCLSACQIKRANLLYDRYKCDTKAIRNSLKKEQDKLCCLKKECTCKSEIKAQKKKIKSLQKTLKCFCKDFEKDFMCLLTAEQEGCYKKLRKGQKKKCKKCKCLKK